MEASGRMFTFKAKKDPFNLSFFQRIECYVNNLLVAVYIPEVNNNPKTGGWIIKDFLFSKEDEQTLVRHIMHIYELQWFNSNVEPLKPEVIKKLIALSCQ